MADPPASKIDLLATGIGALILTAAVTLIAAVFSAVSNVLKWQQLLAGVAIVGAVFTALAMFIIHQIARPLREYFSSVVERFQASAIITKSEWLISSDRLKEIERSTDAAHIWIITRSLEEEVKEDQFGAVIRYNLRRGVRYTYFLPSDPALLARIVKMKDMYKDMDIEFRIIDSPLFDLISLQDMAIFGADGRGASSMAGYMNLPIDVGGNDYFVILGTSQAERIVGTLGRTPNVQG